jgi:lipoprotein-anchoring transpeptidase ErfK/SrfK
VAPFEEQVGDNGDYSEPVRPPAGTYSLVVDYTNQCVYAYKETGGIPELVRVMICTTGGNGNWTPEGVYDMGDDYHRFGYFTSFDCYAQYWTQMAGNFYFHSILYSARDASTYTMSSYNNLGKPGSHGCIRMLVPDARWIYENCAPGTKCEVTTAFHKKKPCRKPSNTAMRAVDSVEPEEPVDAAG